MCGNMEAVNIMAKIYLQLPHDILTVISVDVRVNNLFLIKLHNLIIFNVL